MRVLVECPDCLRQYDATRRKAGGKFHCHCGEVIEIRRPRGHDASVVRCSGCGASRGAGAERCPYCRAEFTLHERDLNTVCPHCLARVSDRARFCHHCATGLVPELDAGEDTDLTCPACQCENRLVSRNLGADRVAVLECGRCAGFWLGHDSFRVLAERARRDALPTSTSAETPQQVAARFGLPTDSVAPKRVRQGSFYRPCAVCGGLMVRRNYGRDSGVIVDLCREHGIWFDAEELARVLAWLRAGGRERGPLVSPQPAPPPPPPPAAPWPILWPRRNFLDDLLDTLARGRW
jgi:Zn-finger nucleic acid-binding protein